MGFDRFLSFVHRIHLRNLQPTIDVEKKKRAERHLPPKDLLKVILPQKTCRSFTFESLEVAFLEVIWSIDLKSVRIGWSLSFVRSILLWNFQSMICKNLQEDLFSQKICRRFSSLRRLVQGLNVWKTWGHLCRSYSIYISQICGMLLIHVFCP